MNLNYLARRITLAETGKQEISIAQVKEVMKLLFTELAQADVIDVLQTIRRYE